MKNFGLIIFKSYSVKTLGLCASVVFAAAIAGCTMHPRGESAERKSAEVAGQPYQQPFEKRNLPALQPNATPDELVNYALLTNGDVETKYWEWRAALEQIPQNGTQKSNIELAFETMITNGSSALENTALSIGNDAMNALMLPTKLGTEARMALHDAQAAGRRFDLARYALRNKVLAAYYEYAMTAELARLEDDNTALLQMMAKISESRLATGMAGATGQTELLKAANEVEMSKNQAATLRAKFPAQVAMLNALLNREGPLDVPAALPTPREPTLDDAALLAAVAKNNPELQALAHEAQGKQDAIVRAKLEYLPDFNVKFSSDLAGITQTIMGSVVLPYLRHEALDAAIRQAEANLHATQAMQRQTANELKARVIGDIAVLRDAERQTTVFDKTLIPQAQRIVAAAQSSYSNGAGMLLDLLESQRSIISLRRMLAELRIEREKQIADLEEVAGETVRR